MLIKAYGQYWNPDTVEWGRPGRGGNSGKLIGETKKKSKKYKVDYWKAKGVYVLHADFRSIYVGQAFDTNLGTRLRQHLTDRFLGRWDMFSWFSVSSPRFTTLDVADGKGARLIPTGTIVNTLEALAILVADPALNRKREKFENAYEAFQPKDDNIKTVRTYLQQILEEVSEIRQQDE